MTRGTLTAPTKSAVVGLLAGALGRPRGANIDDLAAMRFGVRIDQPGQLLVDYHTVSGASHAPRDLQRQRLPTAGGGRLAPAASIKVTWRHYLADAVFVAAVEGDSVLVAALAPALRRPRFPLYLGRRCCPPARPVLLRVDDRATLEDALVAVAWQAGSPAQEEHRRRGAARVELATLIEDPGGDDSLSDQPMPSPAFRRRFAQRPIRHGTVSITVPPADPLDARRHDPLALLG